MRIGLTFLSIALAITSVWAQHDPLLQCGTSPGDPSEIQADIARGKALQFQSRTPVYIPVRYKLVGKSDSSSAAPVNNLLDLIESIKVDYAPHNMFFYLEDSDGTPWDYYYNDDFYSDHYSYLRRVGQSRFRSNKAMTIFVPETANTSSGGAGVTLGYYDRINDYLVFRKNEISADAATASHEIGHYFGLQHTFLGWECTYWEGLKVADAEYDIESPIDVVRAPCFNSRYLIEHVTRDEGANCRQAGDYLCDTPADYNLGFSYNNCDYSLPLIDSRGDTVRPMENNFMGYFQDCNPYEFTEEQVSLMTGNYNSANRRFLRGDGPRVTEPIVDEVEMIFPQDMDTVQYSEEATLNWNAVEYADYYYIQISTSRSFRRGMKDAIVGNGNTSYTFTDLKPETKYYYRVRPFSQVSAGAIPQESIFYTSNHSSNVKDANEPTSSAVLAPNPIHLGASIRLVMKDAPYGEALASIYDLHGRVISSDRVQIAGGNTTLELPTSSITTPGTYVLSLQMSEGIINRRFVVD